MLGGERRKCVGGRHKHAVTYADAKVTAQYFLSQCSLTGSG